MNYTDENRGKVQYDGIFHSRILFDGLKYGSITPTDIDMYFEHHNQYFIFCEFKCAGSILPNGQILALKRLVDSVKESGKEAILFVCTHEKKNAVEDVYAKDCLVEKIYRNGEWIPGIGLKLSEQIENYKRFLHNIGLDDGT